MVSGAERWGLTDKRLGGNLRRTPGLSTTRLHADRMRQRTLGFFALVLLLVPTAGADWASFHNDALGSGFVKDSKYPVYEDVWWSNRSLANQQVYASPVIKDQVVVTADRGGVVRGLDSESGRQLW